MVEKSKGYPGGARELLVAALLDTAERANEGDEQAERTGKLLASALLHAVREERREVAIEQSQNQQG